MTGRTGKGEFRKSKLGGRELTAVVPRLKRLICQRCLLGTCPDSECTCLTGHGHKGTETVLVEG